MDPGLKDSEFGTIGNSIQESQIPIIDSDDENTEQPMNPTEEIVEHSMEEVEESQFEDPFEDDFTHLKEDMEASSLIASKSDFDYRVPIVHNIGKINELNVGEAKKNSKGMFSEYYTYKIHYNNSTVPRRFSDFDKLHKYLKNHYDFCFFPHLPEKNPLTKIKNLAGSNFLKNRRKALELFLKKLLTHSKCREDTKVKEFLDGGFTEFNVDVGESNMKAFAQDLKKISTKNFGKATSFIKGFFKKAEEEEVIKQSESCEEMKKMKTLTQNMHAKISMIITHFEKVINKLKLKAEASEAQAKTFSDISQEEFALSKELLTKLQTIQETVSTGEREFAEEMKETVLFYLKDVKRDIKEALNRIEDSLSKGETLSKIIEKCEKKGDEEKENLYKAKREDHDKNQDVLRSEVGDYVKQVSESIEKIFEIYFSKANSKNMFEVEKWSQINLSEFEMK